MPIHPNTIKKLKANKFKKITIKRKIKKPKQRPGSIVWGTFYD